MIFPIDQPEVKSPTWTTTTQGLTEGQELARLRQIIQTKQQIIESLRRQLEAQDEFRRELMRLL